MVLGKRFFVSPSDSVAMIADNAQACIPYFKGGLKVSCCNTQGSESAGICSSAGVQVPVLSVFNV